MLKLTDEEALDYCFEEIDMLEERLRMSGLTDKDIKQIEIRLATLRSRIPSYPASARRRTNSA